MSRPHHKTRAHVSRQTTKKPAPPPTADHIRRVQEDLRIATLDERAHQAALMQQLRDRHYPAEVPVADLYEMRAMRLGGTA